MKISYITVSDPLDIHNWSGLFYTIANALEKQGIDIDYIGNLKVNTPIAMRIKGKLSNLLKHGIIDPEREPLIARQFAQQILAAIKPDIDILFSPGTIPLSLLETNKPKVFYTDATFASLAGFYDGYSNYSKQTIINANYLEKEVIRTSALAIYSSAWAAQSAIEFYGGDPSKIKVVPFGANVNHQNTLEDIKRMVAQRSTKECNLLFIGVDWERKGGDMAVSVAEKLNTQGIKTTLHIIGFNQLPVKSVPEFVINHGFISKSTAEGKEHMNKLVAACHFLILPTLADCTPVVYPEANSFGLPVISTNVGGIPTIIKEDVNGKTFSPDTGAQAYADYISKVFNDKSRYTEMACSSFNEYETRLNWNTTAKTIKGLLSDI